MKFFLKMETKQFNSFLLSIMGILLTVIAWGMQGYYNDQKQYHTDQKEYNQQRDVEIKNIDENQIILDWRLKVLEKEHDIEYTQ